MMCSKVKRILSLMLMLAVLANAAPFSGIAETGVASENLVGTDDSENTPLPIEDSATPDPTDVLPPEDTDPTDAPPPEDTDPTDAPPLESTDPTDAPTLEDTDPPTPEPSAVPLCTEVPPVEEEQPTPEPTENPATGLETDEENGLLEEESELSIEPLSVSFAIPSEALYIDSEAELPVQATGGTEPYQYAFRLYKADPQVVSTENTPSDISALELYQEFPSQNTDRLACVFDEPGSYYAFVIVTDAQSAQSSSLSDILTVHQPVEMVEEPSNSFLLGTGLAATQVLPQSDMLAAQAPVATDTKIEELQVVYDTISTAFVTYGVPFTWSIKAVGGEGNYRYKFGVRKYERGTGSYYSEVEYEDLVLTRNPVFTYSIQDANADRYEVYVYIYDDHNRSIHFGVGLNMANNDPETVPGKVAQIVAQEIRSGMSEREKAKALHDWMIRNAIYDHRSYSEYNSAEGALLHGLSRCEGFAEAYRLLCVEAGLTCTTVVGEASGQAHAWNAVVVDGEWYHVDVTWDNHSDYTLSYDYFLKKDSDFPYHSGYNDINGPARGLSQRIFPTGDSPVVDTLRISSDSVDLLAGSTYSFVCSYLPRNAGAPLLTWKSSNALVATVDSAGLVTAKAEGTATITVATDHGVSDACSITVFASREGIVTDIGGIPSLAWVGTPLPLTGTVIPSDATNQAISWSIRSAGTTGATLMDGDMISFAAPGTAVITGAVTDGLGAGIHYAKNFTITVRAPFVPVTDITNAPIAASIWTRLTLNSTVQPSNATNGIIAWSIQNAGTTGASLVGGDAVRFDAAGTVTLRASIADGLGKGIDYTKDFAIEVSAPPTFVPVTSITAVPSTAMIGDLLPLTGRVSPSDATNKTIVWSMQGSSATLTDGNMLCGKGAGTVSVTATIANGLGDGMDYTQGFKIRITKPFVPITGITGVPTTGRIGMPPLALSGTVEPDNVPNKIITWSIKDAGTTGASLLGAQTLYFTGAGTVTISASVLNDGEIAGRLYQQNYKQDFTITVVPVPVADVIHLPTTATVGIPLTLTGTVTPSNATKQTIAYSVENAGTTGAVLAGNNKVNFAATGIATIRATITDGVSATSDYTKVFAIEVNEFSPVADIVNVPSTAIVGMRRVLSGTVLPGNASDTTITWSAVGPNTTGMSIARSGNTYSLNFAAPGTATVKATITNGLGIGTSYSKLFTIKVSAPFVPTADIKGIPATATAGVPLTLAGKAAPGDATYQTIAYSVEDAGTTGASLTGGNVLSFAQAGTATIRATITGGVSATSDYTKVFTIKVNAFAPATDIGNVPSTATAGTPLTLAGTVAPSNATYRTIVWSIADAGTTGAVLTSNKVNFTKAGKATIRATIANGLGLGKSYSKLFTITVKLPFVPITGISGMPAIATMGTPLTLAGKVAPSNATYQTITWSIADAGTTGAILASSTKVSFAKTGKATIRATIANGLGTGKNYSKTFTVTVKPSFAIALSGTIDIANPKSAMKATVKLIGTTSKIQAVKLWNSVSSGAPTVVSTDFKVTELSGSTFKIVAAHKKVVPTVKRMLSVTVTLANGEKLNSWDTGKDKPIAITPMQTLSAATQSAKTVTLYKAKPTTGTTIGLGLTTPANVKLGAVRINQASMTALKFTTGGFQIVPGSKGTWKIYFIGGKVPTIVDAKTGKRLALAASYTIKLELWAEGTYVKDANGNFKEALYAVENGKKVPKSKPTLISVKISIK